MSQISPTDLASAFQTPETATGGDLRDLDLNSFLQLMITELQNQDPLDPMENSEILQQMSQIREISATDKLTDTLDAVLTGQDLSTASGLIGKQIKALSDDSQEVSGVVERVSLSASDEEGGGRQLKIHGGAHEVSLKNIREIVKEA